MIRSEYEIFDHPADLGVQFFAPTLADLFINAGLALFDLIAPDCEKTAEEFLSMTVSGDDDVDLLINWLRELLYLFNGKALIVASIALTFFENWSLTARVGVSPFGGNAFEIDYDIKAVTYHQARIERTRTGYSARVIFDL